MDALRALDYAILELERERDKSFEGHLYAFKRVLERAIEIKRESVSSKGKEVKQ